MSTTVRAAYIGTPSLGSSIFVQVRDPDTGDIILARTNGGIREDVSASGCYAWSGALTDLQAYEFIWDEGAGLYASEIVQPVANVTVNVTEPSPLPVQGDANGTLAGLTFLIKRNDTLPYIRRQLQDVGGNAIVLDPLDTVMFTMRSSTDITMSNSPKVHAAAVIIDGPTGVVEYRWAVGDTNATTYSETSTLGRVTDTPYAAEFEVTRIADGAIETFPQGGYIAVSIPPDLDPGVDP